MTTRLSSFSPSQGSSQTGELYEDAQPAQNQKAWCTPLSADDQETQLHAIVLAAKGMQSDTTLFQGMHQDFEPISTLFTHVVEEQLIPILEQQARTYQEKLAHVTQLETEIAQVDGQTKLLESTSEAQTRLHIQTRNATCLAKKPHEQRDNIARERFSALQPSAVLHLENCRYAIGFQARNIFCAVKSDEEKRKATGQDTSFHREFDKLYRRQYQHQMEGSYQWADPYVPLPPGGKERGCASQ